MATWYYQKDAVSQSGKATWAATTAYTAGDFRLPTSGALILYCTVSGTSGGAEPSWPTTYGSTQVDGTVTWEIRHTGEFDITNPDRAAFWPEDVFVSGGILTPSANDLHLFIQDSAISEYALTQRLQVLWSSQIIDAVDASNIPSQYRAILNFSGGSPIYGIETNANHFHHIAMLHFKEVGTTAIRLGGGDYTVVSRCKVTDSANAAAFYSASGRLAYLIGNHFETGATTSPVVTCTDTSLYKPFFGGNFVKSVTGQALLDGNVMGNVFVNTGARSSGGVVEILGSASYPQSFARNIVDMQTPANSGSDVFGIEVVNTGNVWDIVENIVTNITNSGGGTGYAWGGSGTRRTSSIRGNLQYNCDADGRGAAQAPYGQNEAWANVDPDYVDAANDDYRPQTDLSSYGLSDAPLAISTWPPGPYPVIGGGGGGGMLVHPGMGGGIRG